MSVESVEHNIRVSLGKIFHRKHKDGEGQVDIEAVAKEHGVSEDQVREQFNHLRDQNLIGGPLENEGRQIQGVPAEMYNDHNLTDNGLVWAEAGFPLYY